MSLHSGTRRALLRTQARGNGLLNALIAYWPGNEASGNALDLHTNALHLTDGNTVTSGPGIVYATARKYTITNSEYHIRPGDDALLSAGDVELTVAAWCNLSSKISMSNMAILSKLTAVPFGREYYIVWERAVDRFTFRVRDMADTAYGEIRANALGSPSINAWYLIIGWHDPTANTINIQVNNGIVNSLAWASGINDGPSRFSIGSYNGAGDFMDGRIGPTMLWKSAAGGGGVLTAAQRTALYNGGAGLRYDQFTL